MDKNSPFGPMQKRAERSNVVSFPGRQWREERMNIKKSTDPIDVSLSEGNPRELHREVDQRIDAKGASSLDEGRKSTFNKVMDTLGLTPRE